MLLCERMTLAEAAEVLGEHDTRLWRIVCRRVEAAQAGRAGRGRGGFRWMNRNVVEISCSAGAAWGLALTR